MQKYTRLTIILATVLYWVRVKLDDWGFQRDVLSLFHLQPPSSTQLQRTWCLVREYLITMLLIIKQRCKLIITVPPLVSWCLTGEEDRAPGDNKKKKGEETDERWEMSVSDFYKNILCQSCPSEPGAVSPLNSESLVWILHERKVTESTICVTFLIQLYNLIPVICINYLRIRMYKTQHTPPVIIVF